MAHFAQLDENNIVINCIVVHNNELLDENGNESEAKGIQFCKDHYGQDTIWIQSSYNGNFRKHHAGLGYYYDEVKDAFIPRKLFESWTLDEETCTWQPPVPHPEDERPYYWNEETQQWVFDEELWNHINSLGNT